MDVRINLQFFHEIKEKIPKNPMFIFHDLLTQTSGELSVSFAVLLFLHSNSTNINVACNRRPNGASVQRQQTRPPKNAFQKMSLPTDNQSITRNKHIN